MQIKIPDKFEISDNGFSKTSSCYTNRTLDLEKRKVKKKAGKKKNIVEYLKDFSSPLKFP